MASDAQVLRLGGDHVLRGKQNDLKGAQWAHKRAVKRLAEAQIEMERTEKELAAAQVALDEYQGNLS